MKSILFILFILFLTELALGTNENLIVEIERAAVKNNIDPDLAVAIATVESNLNPNAIGALGEVGLFQLRPEFHDVRRGQHTHNIAVAMAYMVRIRRTCSDYPANAWFVCWNHGEGKRLKKPLEFVYYKKVMAQFLKRKGRKLYPSMAGL